MHHTCLNVRLLSIVDPVVNDASTFA